MGAVIVGMPDLDAFAYEAITVSTTAVGFTAATFAPSNAREAVAAMFTVESNPVRYRYDGTAPTATEGHRAVAANDPIIIYGRQNIRNFKSIREGAADATVRVTYLR